MTARPLVPFGIAVTLLLGCDAASPDPLTPPPPPASSVVVLSVNPLARKATAHPGASAPSDNAAVTFTGDNAAAMPWTVTARQGWATVVTASGTGNGSIAWTRSTAGLTIGIYVDTITITAAGASGSPAMLFDTLEITAAPIPLTLAVSPRVRTATAVAGGSVPGDNLAITLSGDGASTSSWTITDAGGRDALNASSGAGSATTTWTRSTAGLVPGVYVDTLTVTAPGAIGSPAIVIDSLSVTAATPLALNVTPASVRTSATQGTAAASGSVTVALTGTGAAAAAWSVSGTAAWAHVTTSGGTGNGTVAWNRDDSGLAPGNYVDTISVAASGANGSPARVLDSLVITAAPVPLTLALAPTSISTTVVQGAAAPAGSVTVTLTGDNAAHATWSAAKRQSWTALTVAGGTGSGVATWSRATTTLSAGSYVDTITVTAPGAANSPASVIDSIIVTPPGGGSTPDLGVLADLHGKQIFPASNPWNQPVDTAQVDPNSDLILSTIGLTVSLHPDWGPTWGFPYAVVPDNTPRYTVPFQYASESDPGPYPIPACPAIEGASVACGPGAGDSHLLIITQNEWKLYEMFYLQSNGAGGWTAGSGAIFDLTNGTNRPAGWTSADAAGLPIFPGLVRYDEVFLRGEITHALRFTVQHTRAAYVPPATHVASSLTGAQYAPMGMRVRLKASFDISAYPAPMQVILRALKKYGMMVADNGSNFYISGTIDPRWNDDYDNLLKQVKVGDFEVVKMNGVVTP